MPTTSRGTYASMSPSSRFYTVGGSLPADSPSYVCRKADEDLFEALRDGNPAYVLDTRQVGKSSLMVRTAERLRDAGRSVVLLDLSGYGDLVTPEQWFFGLLYSMADQLTIADRAEEFWLTHGNLGLAQRWTQAIRDVVLGACDDQLVVFIDEIDAIASLHFSVDSFFAAVRECYNRRAHDSVFGRLTFCLLGVATPSDLIRDPRTTPFNIARRIELTDFTVGEAAPLAEGLGEGATATGAIARVLHWTGGHPYLTQRLCRALEESGSDLSSSAVDHVCAEVFLSRQASSTDDNLRFVRDRILAGHEHADRAAVLTLFLHLRSGSRSTTIGQADPRLDVLMLAGVLRKSDRGLAIRNRIYARVFDARWARSNMPGEEVRRQRQATRRGVVRASLIWALVLASIAMASRFGYVARTVGTRARRLEADKLQLLRQTQAAQHRYDVAVAKSAAAETRARGLERREALARQRLSATEAERANAEARAAAARSETAREQARGRQTVVAVSGQIASAMAVLPTSGFEALEYGLRGLTGARQARMTPPAAAVQGLVNAVNRGVFRRLVLRQPDAVTNASFSPDGERILTAGAGECAYVWDARTGQLVQRIAVQTRPRGRQYINTAEYSRDGKRILTASDADGVALWDATRADLIQRAPLCHIPMQDMVCNSAALSPNGHLIAMPTRAVTNEGCTTCAIKLYDIASGTTRVLCSDRPVAMRDGFIWSLAFSNSGRYLAVGRDDGRIEVHDVAAGTAVAAYDLTRDHDEPLRPVARGVLCVRFDDFDRLIYIGCKDGVVRAWQWDGGHLYRYLVGHQDFVWSVAGGTAHGYLLSAGKDRRVNVWCVDGNQAPVHSLQTHTGPVIDAEFSPDGRQFVTASTDRTAEVWVLTNTLQTSTGSAFTAACFSPEPGLVASSSLDKGLRLFDHNCRYVVFCGYAGEPKECVAFGPRGAWVVTGERGGRLLVYSTRPTPSREAPSRIINTGTSAAVFGVDVSPDGRRIAAALGNGVALIDVASGHVVRLWDAHLAASSSVRYSHDGHRLVSTGDDGSAAIWDAHTTRLIRRLLPPGRLPSALAPLSGRVRDACFTPDGRYVVTADGDQNSYVWDAHTGHIVTTLAGHTAEVTSLDANRAGTTVATASADGTVRIWALQDCLAAATRHMSCHPLFVIRGHSGTINSVRFSIDGQQVVTAGADNTMRVYPATLEAYERRAREILRLRRQPLSR